jgi:hypothetical protein
LGASSTTANQVSLVIFGYFIISVTLFILMALIVLRQRQPRAGAPGERQQPAFQKGERFIFAGFIGGLVVVLAFAVAQLVFNIRI